MMMGKRFAKWMLSVTLLCLVACGGLRYSHLDPAATEFHPKRIVIFPIDTGTYEEARIPMEQIVPGVLAEKKWFSEITDPGSLHRQIAANEELRKAMTDYLAKLQTLNYSDAALSRKIGELTRSDAILLVSVDYWNYTVEKDKNLAKVSIGLKLIDVASGKIMWRAGHQLSESYVLFKPELAKVAQNVLREMAAQMPH
jgi:hypothetical protein